MASNLPPSSVVSHEDIKLEAQGQSHDLSQAEQDILARQLSLAPVKASYLMLYRYATRMDLLIIVVSSVCAIAAGAIFPIMTVVFGNLTSSFQSFFSSHSDPVAFRHEISHLALYFVYLGIAAFFTNYISTVGFIYTGEHITQKLRQKYLAAILHQNIAFFDKLGAGEITNRITGDMSTIQDGISYKVGFIMSGVATFFAALVVGFIKNWKLTLVMISVIVTMVVAMVGISKLMVQFKQRSMEFSGTGATIAEEVFSSIRNTTALGTQERLAQEYDGFLAKAEVWGFRMRVVMGAMLGLMIGIVLCAYALAFWEGSRLFVDGQLTVGQIITVLLAMMMGSGQLGQVAPHLQAFASASATAGPIFSVIDRPSLEDRNDNQKLDEVRGDIELEGIKHIYPSRPEVVVMDGVNLKIPAGKVTALVGASGSRKSTIVGLVERFYSPIRGQVLLDGHDIQTLELKWLRRQMALVSQEPVLFGTTIFANIAHGLIGSKFTDATEARKKDLVVAAAKMANAHSFITSLPEGYDTNVGERGFLLSGGQKQRIAIARAVIGDPRILLLDEATSALDTKSESVVQEALDAASQGRTTIVIAHRLSTIKRADNIVVMSEGSIVEQGTHNELVQSHRAYFQLLEAQKLAGDQAQHSDSEPHFDTSPDGGYSELAAIPSKSFSTRENTISLTKTFSEKSVHGSQPEKRQPKTKYSLWILIAFTASFNKPEMLIMFFGLLCSILAGSAMPIQALFLAHEVSALSLPPEQYSKLRHDVNFWSLMFFVLAISVLLSYIGQGVAFGHGSERLIFRARSKTIRAMLRQDIAFFDLPENSSGALVSMLSADVASLAGMSGGTLGAILSALTTIILALALGCAISWKLGLVCAAAMPVLMCCGFLRFWILGQFSMRSRVAYQTSASYACEATAAIRTIASLTREDDVLETYEAMLTDQSSKDLKSTVQSSLLFGLSNAGMLFASALGFWYGGTLISNHEISLQNFFISYAAVIFGAQATGGVFSYAPDMGKSKQAADTLKSLFDRVPEIDTWSDKGEKLDKVEGAIEFRDVKFQYPTRQSQKVLKGVNLTFKPGQYVALVGPSGCGKSTIISLIERFYDPTAGSIFLDGKDISTLNLRDYRSHIALVSQEPVLYSGTIRENIMLGTEAQVGEDDVIRACKDANIYDFIISLPAGLDTIVGSKGVMLSGGQKQRVAIARALIRDPKILLLDEATSALDSTSEHVVQEALDRVSKGRTTISVAHRLSTIQNADIIYVIDQGEVVESGNHKSLLEARGRYSELVQLQRMKKA